MKLWKPSSAPGAGWEVSAHSDETSYTGEPDPMTPLHAGSLVGRTWYSPLRRILFLWCCFQEIQFLKKSWYQRLLIRLNNSGSCIVVTNNMEIREGNPLLEYNNYFNIIYYDVYPDPKTILWTAMAPRHSQTLPSSLMSITTRTLVQNSYQKKKRTSSFIAVVQPPKEAVSINTQLSTNLQNAFKFCQKED